MTKLSRKCPELGLQVQRWLNLIFFYHHMNCWLKLLKCNSLFSIVKHCCSFVNTWKEKVQIVGGLMERTVSEELKMGHERRLPSKGINHHILGIDQPRWWARGGTTLELGQEFVRDCDPWGTSTAISLEILDDGEDCPKREFNSNGGFLLHYIDKNILRNSSNLSVTQV